VATLDELVGQVQEAQADDRLARYESQFRADFGDLADSGEFALDGSLPIWKGTCTDKEVVIRGDWRRSGISYKVNGNEASFPGAFATMSVEDKQLALAFIVNRIVV
jgi:hypothetical protein